MTATASTLTRTPRATSAVRGTALTRSMAAEVVKIVRRRTVLITAVVVAVVAIGGTTLSILAAEPAGAPGAGGSGPDALLTTQSLADAGGGTAVFAQTAAFTYVFLLAVFVGAVASEFTRGTFRTMLLHQPSRGSLLLGKVSVLVGYAFAAAVGGAVLSWITARLVAPSQGIDTSQWLTVDGLAAGLEDLGRVALFLVGTAIFATTVGVLARSVPIGVGVALVWSGPIENIIGDGWTQAENFFPGLLLRAVLLPGSTDASTARALATLAVYATVALTITVVALRRRDVTS
jgi:ABC-2 type transport system permease protein